MIIAFAFKAKNEVLPTDFGRLASMALGSYIYMYAENCLFTTQKK